MKKSCVRETGVQLALPDRSQGKIVYETAGKKPKKTARVNNGTATNDLVHSAYQATNDAVFPQILELYVPDGAKIADVTFGKGVFWKNVDLRKYDMHASDLKRRELPAGCRGGIDSRKLPYEDNSFFAVVFDPPYMHTPGGTAHNGHQNYEAYYANNAEQDHDVVRQIWEETEGTPPKYHETDRRRTASSGRQIGPLEKEVRERPDAQGWELLIEPKPCGGASFRARVSIA